MSVSLVCSQTEFVFTGPFDVQAFVSTSVSGKVFFFLESTQRGGVEIIPMLYVEAGEEKKVPIRVLHPGQYIFYAKQNIEGIFEESKRILITVTPVEKELLEQVEAQKTEDSLKVDHKSGSVRPSIFYTDKEKNFQKQVATELVERVVNEFVLYFPIRVDNYHPLYGESVVKYYDDPIRLPCIVEWKGTENKNDKFSLDITPTIIVHVLKRRAEEDLGLKIVVGDFIQYGRDFFEIVAVENPTKLFYAFNLQVENDLTCVKARSGLFFLESKEPSDGN